MKNTFFLLAIYLFSCLSVSGQQLDGNRRIVYLINNEVRYLNGGVRASMGGKSRFAIQVNLPPNTIEWMYGNAHKPVFRQ